MRIVCVFVLLLFLNIHVFLYFIFGSQFCCHVYIPNVSIVWEWNNGEWVHQLDVCTLRVASLISIFWRLQHKHTHTHRIQTTLRHCATKEFRLGFAFCISGAAARTIRDFLLVEINDFVFVGCSGRSSSPLTWHIARQMILNWAFLLFFSSSYRQHFYRFH